MKVAIVAPIHPYDDIRVFQKEARTLAQAGYDIVLIAKSLSPLQINSIRVIPVPSYRNHLVRFINLLHIFKLVLGQNADIYHLHNPDTIPLALLLKILGRKVIYDTHEDFAKRILIRVWIPTHLRSTIAYLVAVGEWFVGRICDAAIGTQKSVIKRLGSRSIMIGNPPFSSGPIIEEAYTFANSIQKTTDFRLIYSGLLINEYRGLFTMIDAIYQVNKRVPCRLWLVGNVHENDLATAEKMPGWQYVDYLGHQPLSVAYAHIALSDAGLLTIQNVADHCESCPNKLYEYQLFGIPFIASSFSHWIDQLSITNSGVFVDASDVNQIIETIIWLSQHKNERIKMGERGRRFIYQHYNWELESIKLLAAYDSICHRFIHTRSVTDRPFH